MTNKLWFACLAFLTLSACKKSSESKTITGYWKGKTSSGPLIPASDMSWLLKSDKSLIVYGGSDTATATKGTGTYTNTDSTINAQYRFSGGLGGISVTGKLNANFTRIDGQDALGLSTFTLTKQ